MAFRVHGEYTVALNGILSDADETFAMLKITAPGTDGIPSASNPIHKGVFAWLQCLPCGIVHAAIPYAGSPIMTPLMVHATKSAHTGRSPRTWRSSRRRT